MHLPPPVGPNDTLPASALTKSGTERKRKRARSPSTIRQDKQAQQEIKLASHALLPGCDQDKCKTYCHQNFSEEARKAMNKTFWAGSFTDQKYFIREMIKMKASQSRKAGSDSQKSLGRVYRFRDANGDYLDVCQRFFLNTLGQAASSDQIIRTAFKDTDNLSQSNCGEKLKDKRGSVSRLTKKIMQTSWLTLSCTNQTFHIIEESMLQIEDRYHLI